MILVTGPTGSGKSTTLYATLNIVNRPEVNIITVEDPVEYRLAGINQVQTNPKAGLTFASALRSILRSDPDIVLIGEIRDHETAQIAIEAALTGHLVLSTLHTNDAPSADHPPHRDGHRAVPRRVGRRLRARPAARTPPLRQVQGVVHPDRGRAGGRRGSTGSSTASRARRCSARSAARPAPSTGYKGRLALHEVMMVNEEIERLCGRARARPRRSTDGRRDAGDGHAAQRRHGARCSRASPRSTRSCASSSDPGRAAWTRPQARPAPADAASGTTSRVSGAFKEACSGAANGSHAGLGSARRPDDRRRRAAATVGRRPTTGSSPGTRRRRARPVAEHRRARLPSWRPPPARRCSSRPTPRPTRRRAVAVPVTSAPVVDVPEQAPSVPALARAPGHGSPAGRRPVELRIASVGMNDDRRWRVPTCAATEHQVAGDDIVLQDLLLEVLERGASDLHLTTGVAADAPRQR